MISVILIWIYILLSTYGIGTALLALADKLFHYKTSDLKVFFITGFIGVMTVAQFWSLFGGVGLVCNAFIAIVAAVSILLIRQKISVSRGQLIAGTVIFLVMAYGTSHGVMHYDTALYHAQAIRWIEEYGVVPGLGNLHCRLGYNSAAFPVTALYSFRFLGGQSYHVTAGFCALLLAWECMGIVCEIRNRRIGAPLFARFFGIYYLLIIFDEMVAPASDYYMVTLAFIFFIRAADLMAEENTDISKWSMLTFLSCGILTIKLSGGLLILIALYPGIRLIKEKKVLQFLLSILTGAVIIVPFLARNVIISGRLLYPSTALDIFNVDWKVPLAIAQSDFKEIQVYGRGMTQVGDYDLPITAWGVNWFANQSGTDRLLIALAIVGVMCFVVKCLYYGFSLAFGKRRPEITLKFLSEGLISICFVFWLFTSPLMRYGCLYVYLAVALIGGNILKRVCRSRWITNIILVSLMLVCVYKAGMFGKEAVTGFRGDCLLRQQDYTNYPVVEYEIDGNLFYMPAEGDQTGYDPFPTSPWRMDIRLRGNSLKQGFAPCEVN